MPHAEIAPAPPTASLDPTPIERARIRYLVKRLNDMSSQYSLGQATWDEWHKRRRPLVDEIDEIGQAVLRRDLGIELPMTLRLTDGSCALMATQVEIDFRFQSPDLYWYLSGSTLRKDGSIGENEQSIPLDRMAIERRHLDGKWARIKAPTPGHP